MAERTIGQLSLAEALGVAGLGSNAVLDRIGVLTDWSVFSTPLAGLADAGPGRPSYPPLSMFKALLLQQWYGLSDAELESQLGDRLSFRRFVGLALGDPTPDHTTLCRFRNRLIAEGRLEVLFAALDRQLETAGLIVKRGTMVDATLIEAARARPGRGGGSQGGAGDPDAGFAKKQGKPGSTYGYKAHVGVDQGSGLIRAIVTTAANVNDTTPADALVRGDERAVYADMAYDSHARRAALSAQGIKPRIMRRPNKHHPVLPPRLQRLNRLIARRRAAVETTFAVFKQHMGVRRARYLGLAKTTGQMLLVALAFNLRKAATLAM